MLDQWRDELWCGAVLTLIGAGLLWNRCPRYAARMVEAAADVLRTVGVGDAGTPQNAN